MPRPKRATAANAPNSIVAAAANVTRRRPKRNVGSGVQEWQSNAWYFYDTVGEFRFGVAWRAAACSRARLKITERRPDGTEADVTEGTEVEALASLFGGDAGHGQMLGMIALHFDVPGETYLVGEVVPPTPTAPDDAAAADEDEVDRWGIYSNEEITKASDSAPWVIDRGDGRKRELDPETSQVYRLWRPHPRKFIEADSPARAVLPILRELEGLTQHVAATIDSRLSGAGILCIPSEASFSPPPGVVPETSTGDALMDLLAEVVVTSIAQRDSAARVAPIVIRAPGAVLGNIQHITFDSQLDEHAQELREECVRRLALGLDLPPEVLLGQADSNHWSAWQIEESALKMHVEPLLELITAALTERWLSPAVEDLDGAANPARRVNYDVTELALRPDLSEKALELYDRIELSGKAMRRETGFEEGDKPNAAEIKQMVLAKLATSGVTPDQVPAILAQLGIEVPAPAANAAPPIASVPEPEAPAEPEGNRDIPAEAASANAILASADLLAARAIERAWNKAGGRRRERKPVPADQITAAMSGCWAAVPRTAATLGVDPQWLTACLDRYTRAVLEQGAEHNPEVLAQVLSSTLVARSG